MPQLRNDKAISDSECIHLCLLVIAVSLGVNLYWWGGGVYCSDSHIKYSWQLLGATLLPKYEAMYFNAGLFEDQYHQTIPSN